MKDETRFPDRKPPPSPLMDFRDTWGYRYYDRSMFANFYRYTRNNFYYKAPEIQSLKNMDRMADEMLELKPPRYQPIVIVTPCDITFQPPIGESVLFKSPSITWRNPNCKKPEPSPLPILDAYIDRPSVPEGNCLDGLNWYVVTRSLYFTYHDGITYSTNSISNAPNYSLTGQGWEYFKATVSLESASFPPELQEPIPTIRLTFKATSENRSNPNPVEALITLDVPVNTRKEFGTNLINLYSGNGLLGWIALNRQTLQDNISSSSGQLYNYSFSTNVQQSDYIVNPKTSNGSVNVITPFRQYSVSVSNCFEDFFGNIGCAASWTRMSVQNQQIDIKLICSDYKKPEILPPPPPKRKCCMCCNNDDRLLRLILARIGNLPVNVPTTLLTENGIQPSQTKPINSLTQMMGYLLERITDVLGEFEVEIDIEDADPIAEGNQSKRIRLPNLAEAIAEMYSLLVQTTLSNEILVNVTNRTMLETGQVKLQTFSAYRALMALIDYINFPYSEEKAKLPLLFTPGEYGFSKVLQSSEQEVAVLDYTNKDSLQNKLMDLLQAAAIIRSVHFRPLSKDDVAAKQQIQNDLRVLLKGKKPTLEDLQKFADDINKIYNSQADGDNA